MARPERIIVRDYDGTPLAQVCSRCDELKLLDDFVKNSRAPLGTQTYCKVCDASAARRRYAANPEAARAKNAALYERRRNRTDEEVAADRARLRPDGTKTCRDCRLTLPLRAFHDCRVAPDGLQPRCGPCHVVARHLKVNRSDLADRWADLDLYVCVYCGADFEDIEHVVPRAQDGVDHVENLVPSCRTCNRGPGGKFAQTPAEWQPEKHRAIRLAVARVREANAA